MFLTGNRNEVGLRSGRSGPENSAFGLLHAEIDHDVYEPVIGRVITNNAGGISQGNNRFLYGGTDYNLNPPVSVEVIEVRAPSNSSPDKYFLGVVTAYCRVNGVQDNYCPPGIND